ncbi:hypothetical protein Fmac_016772 [Flemingia macrophylla]|uniref:Vitamin K epoxide reductase domain-containing protein n=1 Tax=Flemingia macrophylla TaxID=520843 RepID=A0ABD1MID4_9FABA
MSSSSSVLPNFSDEPNIGLRGMVPYVVVMLSSTLSWGYITMVAYNKGDNPMVLFAAFSYLVYNLLQQPYRPTPDNNFTFLIWFALSAFMLGSACAFATFLTLLDSICFFCLAIAGSALLFCVWWHPANNQLYVDLVYYFAPILLLLFGISRTYLATQLIFHAAIMGARTLFHRHHRSTPLPTN